MSYIPLIARIIDFVVMHANMSERDASNRAVVFGDIHGNITALEAVFDDMSDRELGNDRYCLGDLVGYGTFPNEVVEFVRSRSIPTIMGNYDQGVGNNSDDCGCAYQTETEQQRGEQSIRWTNEQITDENREYLRTLDERIRFELGDLEVVLVHGSPRRINEYLYEDRPDSSFERLLDSVEADVLESAFGRFPFGERSRHLTPPGVLDAQEIDPKCLTHCHSESICTENSIQFVCYLCFPIYSMFSTHFLKNSDSTLCSKSGPSNPHRGPNR